MLRRYRMDIYRFTQSLWLITVNTQHSNFLHKTSAHLQVTIQSLLRQKVQPLLLWEFSPLLWPWPKNHTDAPTCHVTLQLIHDSPPYQHHWERFSNSAEGINGHSPRISTLTVTFALSRANGTSCSPLQLRSAMIMHYEVAYQVWLQKVQRFTRLQGKSADTQSQTWWFQYITSPHILL